MATFHIAGGNLIIEGIKYHTQGMPVVGAYTELYHVETGQEFGKGTTNRTGYWKFIVPVTLAPSGQYIIKFFGSGLRETLPPLGQWEIIHYTAPGGGGIPSLTTINILDVNGKMAPNENGWWNADLNISFTTTTTDGSIPTTYYRIYVDPTQPIEFTQYTAGEIIVWPSANEIEREGRWYIDYYSTTNKGGIETIRTVNLFIDKTAPIRPQDFAIQNILGGYGRVIITWNAVYEDMLSGLWKLQIYRGYGIDHQIARGNRKFLKTISNEELINLSMTDSTASTLDTYTPWYWGYYLDNAGNGIPPENQYPSDDNDPGWIPFNYKLNPITGLMEWVGVKPIPMEPADVQGALGMHNWPLDDTTWWAVSDTQRAIRYSVPVQFRKFYFANNAPITINSISIIKDPVLSLGEAQGQMEPPWESNLYTGDVIIDGQAYTLDPQISPNITIPAGEHVGTLTSPQWNVFYVRIYSSGKTFADSAMLDGNGHPTLKLTDFRISTFLAADEIDAGRIRVEQGISISKGGLTGVFIDNYGISLKHEVPDVPGTYEDVINLYNTVVAGGPDNGLIARFGTKGKFDIYNDGSATIAGWDITENGISKTVTNISKIELTSGPIPYFAVSVPNNTGGMYETIRLGRLNTLNPQYGLRMQTAPSGQRFELDSTSNQLKFYNSEGSEVVRIGTTDPASISIGDMPVVWGSPPVDGIQISQGGMISITAPDGPNSGIALSVNVNSNPKKLISLASQFALTMDQPLNMAPGYNQSIRAVHISTTIAPGAFSATYPRLNDVMGIENHTYFNLAGTSTDYVRTIDNVYGIYTTVNIVNSFLDNMYGFGNVYGHKIVVADLPFINFDSIFGLHVTVNPTLPNAFAAKFIGDVSTEGNIDVSSGNRYKINDIPVTPTSRWPDNLGAGSSGYLRNDGTGVLTWATPAGGTGTGHDPLSLVTFDETPTTYGLKLISDLQILSLTAADDTHPGGINIGTQRFSGVKTFNDGIEVWHTNNNTTYSNIRFWSFDNEAGEYHVDLRYGSATSNTVLQLPHDNGTLATRNGGQSWSSTNLQIQFNADQWDGFDMPTPAIGYLYYNGATLSWSSTGSGDWGGHSIPTNASTGYLYNNNGTWSWTTPAGVAHDPISLTNFDINPTDQGLRLSGAGGQVLAITAADATHPGGISLQGQDFAGMKNFTGYLRTGKLNAAGLIYFKHPNDSYDHILQSPGATFTSNQTIFLPTNGGTLMTTDQSHAAVTITTGTGLNLNGQQLSLNAASESGPGAITMGDQTFSGNKVFNSGRLTVGYGGFSYGALRLLCTDSEFGDHYVDLIYSQFSNSTLRLPTSVDNFTTLATREGGQTWASTTVQTNFNADLWDGIQAPGTVNQGVLFNSASSGTPTVGWQTILGIQYGGTGGNTAAQARASLGLIIGTDIASATHTHSEYALASTSHVPLTLGTANGLSLSGTNNQTLSLTIASETTTGVINTIDQSIKGLKTFYPNTGGDTAIQIFGKVRFISGGYTTTLSAMGNTSYNTLQFPLEDGTIATRNGGQTWSSTSIQTNFNADLWDGAHLPSTNQGILFNSASSGTPSMSWQTVLGIQYGGTGGNSVAAAQASLSVRPGVDVATQTHTHSQYIQIPASTNQGLLFNTASSGTPSVIWQSTLGIGNGGTGATTYTQAQTNLHLVPGADVATYSHTHTGVYEPARTWGSKSPATTSNMGIWSYDLAGYIPVYSRTLNIGGTTINVLCTDNAVTQWQA